MKYSCGVIKDLIPLYIDEVCSEDSKTVVKEHLEECEDCRGLLERMSVPVETDTTTENRSMEKSFKKVKKKIKIRNIIFLIIGGVAMFLFLRYILPAASAIGILVLSSVLAKPVVVTDIAQYSECIGTSANEEYGINPEEQLLYDVFPEEINGDTKNFEYIYYNPFDPQYVSYLTVEYDDEEYAAEMERLGELGINEDYTKYYSVTGEPEGFNLAAMRADYYYGFGYALIPEEENNTVTYVGIHFCNYFLDLDIDKYVPKEYLLEGFNAKMDNPYEKACMGK